MDTIVASDSINVDSGSNGGTVGVVIIILGERGFASRAVIH